MTTQEASELLKKHNEWRRSGDGEMASPTEIGEAIDILLAFYQGVQVASSPKDSAVAIEFTPKGSSTIDDLYNKYKLSEEENKELKEYREKVDRANKQYFNSSKPLK